MMHTDSKKHQDVSVALQESSDLTGISTVEVPLLTVMVQCGNYRRELQTVYAKS